MADLNRPTLSPCPFCAAAPIFEGAWARHPQADCLMSDEVLFAWTVPENVRRWNQRMGVAPAVATAVWPDFIAPPKYENPDPCWVDPALPDFRLIWKVARECGYAIGLHGSMKRDCDMIAAPWTDEAVIAFDLIERLCKALNATKVGKVAGKPHGRLGWILQIDGYVKHIDISVMPRACDLPSVAPADPVPIEAT